MVANQMDDQLTISGTFIINVGFSIYMYVMKMKKTDNYNTETYQTGHLISINSF